MGGLDPSLTETTNRVAAAGFVAMAPDLYHGEIAQHNEMDRAAHLMQTLNAEPAARIWPQVFAFLRESLT